MYIDWSEGAIREMETRFGQDAKRWKLVFDTEGCGCSVNGVPTFWHVSSPDPDDIQAGSNGVEVWIKPQHELFFDEILRVTYLPEHRSFKLASDGQIYTNRLKLQDRTTTTV
ncbi:iron-sulfur cluster biosynthesis family protein [Cohnella yongneupensis]|uniref:Iron-sulfur cluster biosynthesis family protein n=1 Tax=Cohnella yongneupensis TaxID=425006 RepID=A0ABW0R6D0_9BACL